MYENHSTRKPETDMKNTLLTLAAVLALSGSAFAAGSTHPVKQAHNPVCVDAKTHVKLDCASTGSVEKESATQKPADGHDPRLGISIDPWILPSTF
jgi:predicted lipoprotein with Yx(FWY)xxD motif